MMWNVMLAFAVAGSVAFVTNHLLNRKNNHDYRRLEDQHKTIEGSTSQQQKQLRCMDDHANSCLTSECEAAQALKKMAETYTSAIDALEEFVDAFHEKELSDMEHIQTKLSSQTLATESFVATDVLEAKDVICNIQNSLDEQKHLLAFSIQQQEEGLKQSLTSALAISEATLNFFNDIHQHSLRVVKIIEETQNERTHQLVNFEKFFLDEAVREEEQALEKNAAILAALTSKRVARVSEACRNMQDTSMKQSKRLQLEMCNMQQVSEDATKEVGKYVENVKSHFIMQLLSTNDSKALMENCLHDCSKRVYCSRDQWENAQSALNNISKNNPAEIKNTVVEANINSNYDLYQEFVSSSPCMESDYNVGTQNLLEAINDSKMLDCENKKEIDSVTTQWVDELHSVPELCCFVFEEADEHTSLTPKERMIVVPSHTSIKEMKTHVTEEKSKNISKQKPAVTKIITEENSKNRSKWKLAETKIPRLKASPNRIIIEENSKNRSNRKPAEIKISHMIASSSRIPFRNVK